MSVTVTLEYRRVGDTTLSTGRILSNEDGLVTEEGEFESIEYHEMMKQLATVLANWDGDRASVPVDVVIQRTDHEGLVPYTLDKQTVDLLRTDPVAGIKSLSFESSPPAIEQAVKVQLRPATLPPVLKAGQATLADAFGENIAFRVREHELECPGCGYWGMFTTPGLLSEETRAGGAFKTAFICPKNCRRRFVVSCQKEWGFIEVDYLLKKTDLDRFYFPRAWNDGKPWVSRKDLQQKYDEYKKEKEST